MPTPSLPYKCGSPGCDRKFEKPEYLHHHIKDFHSPSRPLPKQQTYECGVEGCEAPSFSQLSCCNEHTAKAHTRSPLPLGFLNTRTPIPITNTRSTQAPVLMSQHVPPQEPPPSYTANEAQYVLPYVYSRHSSTSTSLAAQNAVSSPDYAPAAEVLQRLMELELRQVLIDKSTLKVGMHFVELAEKFILSSTNNQRIWYLERVEWIASTIIDSLAYSAKFRTDVRMTLGYNDSIKIQKAFLEDDRVISHLFREVIYSGKEDILHLSCEKATSFMDAVLWRSDDTPFVLPARRLLKKPTQIRQIARGGFADIFLGRYKEQDVPEPKKEIGLLQEVLTWVHLKHIYDYPPCIVTPYMRNGTMKDFVKNQSSTLPDRRVDRLLFETAQGLAYLHSQNIIHGDLPGFGLAIVTDATLGTTSTTQCGSSRWMAPELLDYQLEFKRTKASDVYAFACLCYTGEQPFRSIQRHIAVILQILDQKRPPRPSGPPDGTRSNVRRAMGYRRSLLAHKPSDRPDIDKVSGLILLFMFFG
ncbi:kinase-like domain-containing protein [Mycena olivaceomarginata]|nr:kinase-like domain-containing protein [Mycena olivaceomarginata]